MSDDAKQIDEIDRRLVRVEAKVDSIERNEQRREDTIEGLRTRVNQIALDIREVLEAHKMLKWLIGVGIPVLLLLEGWQALFA